LHEQGADSVHILLLKLGLAVYAFDADWQLLLESCDNLTSALVYKLLALLHYVRRNDIVLVFGRNLNLDSFDAIPGYDSNSILFNDFIADSALLGILKTN